MRKKVLLCYNYILHYRIPLFNLLSKRYDLTVLHSGDKAVTHKDNYKEIIFNVKKTGPFFVQEGILDEVKKKDYDVIILLFDLRWLNTIRAMYVYNKQAKLILWGAWLTKSNLANKARLYFSKRSDANIFYTEKSRQDFISMGLKTNKTYVANNTFDVGERVKSFENPMKDKILFVGSLDARKQNDVLITAFSNILDKIPKTVNLTIVGSGLKTDDLKKLVKIKNIENRVDFVGKVVDTALLKNYYKEAIVSVSFGQAGLSVLQSLGYGVPFLTKVNAISGGEKTNIKHRKNGLFCDDNISSLEKNLIEVCNNIDFARKLGENAYSYYSSFCTIENMCQGFLDAIEETCLAKVDRAI